MKIYRVRLDDDDPEMGLIAISLVDFPAVERNFLHFAGEEKKKQRIALKADEDRHMITGVALLADTPIYRYDPAIGDYYVVFEADTIRQLVERYSRNGLLNLINLQHDADTYSFDSCVMVESYFTDRARGIVPSEFADVPDGSWVVTFKVNDDALWEAIKASHGQAGGLNGFSVEVVSDFTQMLRAMGKGGEDEITTLEELAEAMIEKKKTDYRVTRSDVKDTIRKDRQVVITIGDKENEYRGQIKDLGRRKGDDVMTFYDIEAEEWMIVSLDKVTRIRVTDLPIVPWNFDLPSYRDILDDDEIVVTDSRIADRETIATAINGQFFAMIYYDDETDDAATGARQVQICAYGHHVSTGNEIFRAYEWFGDTSTVKPAWKLFLTKRVRSFRLMTEAERWKTVPPQYHMNDAMINVEVQVDDTLIS